jgi:hypothetical protein
MMDEFSWLTGCAGDSLKIYVQWFDDNNCRHETSVEMRVAFQDKPRKLEIRVNENLVQTINSQTDRPISDLSKTAILRECEIRKIG